jgi:hypothetical protein
MGWGRQQGARCGRWRSRREGDSGLLHLQTSASRIMLHGGHFPAGPFKHPRGKGCVRSAAAEAEFGWVSQGRTAVLGTEGKSEGGRGWVDAFSPRGIKRTDWRAALADLESAASAWPVDFETARERFCFVQITHYHGQRVTEAGFSHRASDLLPLPLLVRVFWLPSVQLPLSVCPLR